MRLIVMILLSFLLFQSLPAQETGRKGSFHLIDVQFSEFVHNVFSQTGVRIFFNEATLGNFRVSIDADSVTAITALCKVLQNSEYKASVWNESIVITTGKNLVNELPSYERVTDTSGALSKALPELTENENRYISGRRTDQQNVITAGKRENATGKLNTRVTGRVLDDETGEPLTSVPVYINETKTGVLSDDKGFFTVALPPGKYNIVIDYLGYEDFRFLLDIISEGEFTVRLKKAAIRLEGVVITGESSSAMRIREPGLAQVSVSNIRSLPVMMGERDILKVSGTLPGIISPGEGSAGLNVRGSGSDQNAFYLNRIPVYNTSHLFGFFSAFNTDIIKDFSVYKGHIPVEYGGRLASVFNITARQGNRKHYTARGGISPVAASLALEGPLKKDTSSFIFSLRSSYSNWILSRIRDTTINASLADFNDLSGGINWDVSKTRISLFLYHSYDRFRLADINDYSYSNNGGSLIFNRSFGSAVRGEIALTGSVYEFSTTDKLEISSAWRHSYKLGQYGMLADFTHALNEDHNLGYGMELSLYDLNRGNVDPYGEKSLLSRVNLGTERGYEGSLFFSDTWKIRNWLTLNAGIRYTTFIPVGPSTVYLYGKDTPIDPRYIIDTLFFRNNQPVKRYNEPDLRLSVNLLTDENGSVKLAYNQTHQNLFMLSTTTTLAPNTQWKLADFHLRPSQSRQVSAGIFRVFSSTGMEASAELFYKKTYNYPEFRGGADFIRNALVETAVLQAKQNAYGLELYLKRSSRKLDGWISYTYSRSVVEADGPHSWQRLNNGIAYPSDYDIPNSLNAVLNYHLTWRVIFASIFTWKSGRPVTYPESVYYINGSPFLNYSLRNAYRIPDYLRLDLSLTIEGNLKAQKLIHSSFIFNLYNAAGRMNAYSVYFNTEEGRIKSYKYTVIGVPVFTATWLFKFGNYASE